MSWKVYEGRRFNKHMSALDLTEFRYKLVEKATELKNNKLKIALGEFTAEICDNITIGIEDVGWKQSSLKTLQSYIVSKFYEKVKTSANATSYLDGDIDTHLIFNLMIYPVSNKTILCLPLTEHPEFIEILDAQAEISEYGYWDSSDAPKNISSKQWEARRNHWKKAMNNGPACGDSGLLMEIIPAWNMCNDIYSIEATEFPDKNKRARKLAVNSLIAERTSHLTPQEKQAATRSIFMDLLTDKQAIDARAAEIAPLLLTNLNRETLSKISK